MCINLPTGVLVYELVLESIEIVGEFSIDIDPLSPNKVS